MSAGKITLQANDGKTLSLVAPEGMVANTTDVVLGATIIHNATSKTTPVDADELSILDSTTSFSLKKLTFTNLKATLLSYFGVKISSDGFSIKNSIGGEIKNQCTAWVNFDGTTTPPTIRDSYNVSDVVRTATGEFEVYFNIDMDNTNYTKSGFAEFKLESNANFLIVGKRSLVADTVSKCVIQVAENASAFVNSPITSIQIFGGKE